MYNESMPLDDLLKPPPCEECGMAAVHHNLERWTIAIEDVLGKALKPLAGLSAAVTPIIDRAINAAAPALARALSRARLGKMIYAPDGYSTETAQFLWASARARGIMVREFRLLGLPRNLFIASHNGTTCAYDTLPRPIAMRHSLSWMDDKGKMKRRFAKAGFPVARGGVCGTYDQALTIFHALEKPVIVKPKIGSGGRHTTAHIVDEKNLQVAFLNAMAVCPRIIVEEELEGPVFRATLIGRKLVGVLRRDPPTVTGDGTSTIRELVEKENEHPLRAGPAFARIATSGASADRELEWQKLSLDSVPLSGQSVRLHFKVNWGVGGISYDATEETHPDNKTLFENIAKFLREDIVGIDFIIDDISKSWRSPAPRWVRGDDSGTQLRAGVIECNSQPHIGNHHIPFTGPPRDAAGAVWDMIFPESKTA